MDERFNMLSGVILQKPLDQCSVTELEELTSTYPYFAPAHFLLLKKKEEAGQDATAILQKAMLYYHDPVSFAHFIHPQKTDERFLYDRESKPVPLTPAFTPHPTPAAPADTDKKAETIQEELVVEESFTEQKTAAINEVENVTIDETVAEPPAAEINDGEYATVEQTEADNTDAKEPGEVSPTLPERLMKESLVSTESNPPEEKLAFEPYHTVDYFASQGIRPSQEEPKDALGRQLKSFTEWLKTMKKLPDPSTPVAKPVDPVVEAMANRSVGDAVVVTEAMAEVWIKQGNKERAREIYRKLSLQDPSKSPYFAAKIDNLNAD